MALPVWLGGLGITNPSSQTSSHYNTSLRITAPLATLILQQSHEYPPAAKAKQIRVKNEARKIRRQHWSIAATELKDKLPNNMHRAMALLAEKGGSSWLSTLPIMEHGFALHKGAFRDALCLRYS